MKPFFMQFTQGLDNRPIWVNMNQVCHIMPNVPSGAVLTFNAVLQDEPAWLTVNESPESIGNRSEWRV